MFPVKVPVHDKSRRDQIGAELRLLKHCREDVAARAGVMRNTLPTPLDPTQSASGGEKLMGETLGGFGASHIAASLWHLCQKRPMPSPKGSLMWMICVAGPADQREDLS